VREHESERRGAQCRRRKPTTPGKKEQGKKEVVQGTLQPGLGRESRRKKEGLMGLMRGITKRS